MLKIFGFIISVFLIFIVFLRTPEDSASLTSFASKSKVFGSPRSSGRFLDRLTVVEIIIYLIIAFKLNLAD
jgi:protein translocase SecG subunit